MCRSAASNLPRWALMAVPTPTTPWDTAALAVSHSSGSSASESSASFHWPSMNRGRRTQEHHFPESVPDLSGQRQALPNEPIGLLVSVVGRGQIREIDEGALRPEGLSCSSATSRAYARGAEVRVSREIHEPADLGRQPGEILVGLFVREDLEGSIHGLDALLQLASLPHHLGKAGGEGA